MARILKLSIIFGVLSLFMISSCGAYVVDGNLGDWGISLNDLEVGLCELNAPINTCDGNITKAMSAWKGPMNAEWIIANNRNPLISNLYPIDWTYYNATGVHAIKSSGANMTTYFVPVFIISLSLSSQMFIYEVYLLGSSNVRYSNK